MLPGALPTWLAPVVRALDAPPAQLCQAFFVLLGAATVALTLLPAATQTLLLDYGARDTRGGKRPTDGTETDKADKTDKTDAPVPEPGTLETCLAAVVARLQVPHAWFTSFYVLYLACTAAWAVQWWLWRPQDGPDAGRLNIFAHIVARQHEADYAGVSASRAGQASSMALLQVYVALLLEAAQAARRVYEHLFVLRPSASTMNVAHFALGISYYLVMSVAVWVEGSQAILAAKQSRPLLAAVVAVPSETWAKIAVGSLVFLLAWIGQYRCHAYLASLKKYSLPDQGLFRYLVSPHYTCEIVLYLALSIVTAPAGRLANRTMLSSQLFVLPVLGVTATRTKKWYGDKFGPTRVAGKWKMIPFIF